MRHKRKEEDGIKRSKSEGKDVCNEILKDVFLILLEERMSFRNLMILTNGIVSGIFL